MLVIDGHDGTGKTTLARGLAKRIGADYVTPFAGADGGSMLEAAEAGHAHEADRLAREMLAHQLNTSTARIKVVDRHWMTVFTLLPESLWEGWLPLPPTVLCWANLDTIYARLSRRTENPQSTKWHSAYLRRYAEIARRFRVPIVRTDQRTVVDALEWLHAWASTILNEIS
jgi:adenylate kinase family enzyme